MLTSLPLVARSHGVRNSFGPSFILTALLLLAQLPCAAQLPLPTNKQLAPVPPMGWNSWDSYSETITEEQVRTNADWMAKHLKQFGWQYIVIDEGWYVENPGAKPADVKFAIDEYGRFIPVVSRFPSAANGAGFKPLADYVHSLGLQFGIHIMRGIPREAVAKNTHIFSSPYKAAEAADTSDACPWNSFMYGVQFAKSGQAYYDSIAQLYASWGVDFIKADCISDHPYKLDEIRMLSFGIKASDRPMLLSLSPGPTGIDKGDEVSLFAEMWRISDDFWDDWKLLRQQFDYARDWAPSVGKNNTWPDADMLPFGKLRVTSAEGGGAPSKFTADEQQTVMTLWSIFRSPLIFGGDLPSNDAATTTLITNEEVLDVNQRSTRGHQVLDRGNIRVWTADGSDSHEHYVAVFNLGERAEELDVPWSDLGIPGSVSSVRNLWTHKAMQATDRAYSSLRPHASELYKVVFTSR